MLLAGWMEINGVEVVNVGRTLNYIRQGLAGAEFDVCVQNNVSEGPGYESEYFDEYSGDPFDVRNLCCHCWAMPVGPYASPAYDSAPWYDANRPESGEFYGIWPEIRLVAAGRRNVIQRAQGRADIGPLVVGARIVQVEGLAIASSEAGMAYGERWLNAILAGGAGGCSGDVLTILPACPPEDETDGSGAYRQLARVGLVDGPLFAPVDSKTPEAVISQVSWQMAAGEPWLRSTTVLESSHALSGSFCTTMGPMGPIATGAAVLTFRAGASALGAVDVYAKAGACPGSGPDIAAFTVSVPALGSMVVDASRETVEVRDVTGLLVGGPSYLDFAGLLTFIKARPGTSVAITIDSTAGTGLTGATVDIAVVSLEL